MAHQDSLFSPTTIFHYFMLSVWTWILLERDSSWSLSLRTSSIQCQVNLVLVTPCKPSCCVKDVYFGHTYDLKQMVDIWTSMDLVSVECGAFSQKFH